MLRSLLFGALFLVFPATAQTIAYQHTIVDGYEHNRLVRPHLIANYYHYSNPLTDGYVLMLKPMYDSDSPDSNHIQIDTICRFAGETQGNQRFGTFLFLPKDYVFYLETYNGYYRNGPCTGYYYTGRLHSQVVYRNNRVTGVFRKYYANGYLAEQKKLYEQPASVMEYQSYHTSGRLLSKGVFYNNHKIHEWKYYDRDGSLSKIEYYNQRGRLLAVKPKEKESEP